MRSTTFNHDFWTVPIKDEHSAADIAAIRVRGHGIESKSWAIPGTTTPPPEVRQGLQQHLAGYEGKIRIETLNAKSEPIGTKNYTVELPPVMTTPAPTPAPVPIPASESSAFTSLNILVNRLSDMVGSTLKSNTDLVESIRKSKQDAPEFFVGLYKEALKEIKALQAQVLELTSERDIALTLLQKSKDSPEKANALLEGLRELRGFATNAVPTVPQLLQKMIQSLLEGKTQDLISLLKEQSMAARVKIVVGLTMAAVEATPPEERQEFLMASQEELKKALGIE